MTRPAAGATLEWWRHAPEPAAVRGATPHIEAGSSVPFRFLVALTVVMVLAPQSFLPVLAPLRLALVTAGLAAITHLSDRRARQAALATAPPALRTVLLLTAWAIVTLPWSLWPGGSVDLFLDLFFKSVVTYWLVGSIVRTSTRFRQLAWTLSLIAIPLALTAISQFLGGDFSKVGESRISGYEGGLVKNPNDLALVLNMLLPLTVYLTATESRRWRRFVLAGILVAEVAGVVATFSRTGFVTLAVIAVLLAWRMSRRPGSAWLWVGLITAGLAVPLLPAQYTDRLATITDAEADPTGSAQSRWDDQVIALGAISQHPLIGTGIGNDHLAMNAARGTTWLHVHNAYLVIAMDLGLPGLALLGTFIWRSLAALNRVRRRHLGAHGTPALLAAAEGVSTSLIAIAVAAVFHPIAYHVYLYYIAGLATAVTAMDAAEGLGA